MGIRIENNQIIVLSPESSDEVGRVPISSYEDVQKALLMMVLGVL